MAWSGRTTAYLGIDVGTSGLKATLVAADGRLLAPHEQPYVVAMPQPGYAESDPASWLAAATAVIERMSGVLADVRVAGIGCAGQMHGAVLCDASGGPLAPAILWPDRRASAVMRRWQDLSPAQLASLANPLVPGMTGPMLAWLAEHRPGLVDQAAVALHAKDVVREHLTDRTLADLPVSDRSDASATLLWDIPADRWAEEICAEVGVPRTLLPAALPSATVVGQTDWLGRVVPGASVDVPVVAGAGDTPAALLAVGSSALQVNFGTGAQVLAPSASAHNPGADPSTHLYADAGNRWYAMAAVQNAGLALDRARRLLGMTWGEMVDAAARSDVGAGGTSFLPFFSGERGGIASPASHGGWLGLDVETGPADLARAAFEGVAFAVRRSVELMGDVAASAPEVTLTGGGGREPWVRQLLADVLGRPVRFVDIGSASAIGAAMLAARGTGVSLRPIRSTDVVTEPRSSAAMEPAYREWRARCPAAEL